MNPIEAKKATHALTKIASSSFINLIFGFIRMKVAAVVLGPSGIGLIGYLQQILTVCSSFFAFGTRESAVLNVSKRCGEDYDDDALNFIDNLKVTGTYLSILGGVFSYILLIFTFKEAFPGYTQINLIILSLGVSIIIYSGILLAILNGRRNISSLAKITIYSSIYGSIIGSLLIYFYEVNSIDIFVILSGSITLLFSAYYNYKSSISPFPKFVYRNKKSEIKDVLKFGAPIMLSTFVVALCHLFIRQIVEDKHGLENLGYFTSAWLISQYYIGFFYTAIASDFYPAVAALERKDKRIPDMLNKQLKLGIIFTAPLLIGLTIFGDIVITIAYTSEFIIAVAVLQWLVLGDLFKTLTQPLSSILMSFSKGKTYFLTRFVTSIIYVLFTFIFVEYFGIEGVGIAYLLSYIFHFKLISTIIKKMIVWELSACNKFLIFCLLVSIIACILLSHSGLDFIYLYLFSFLILIPWTYFLFVEVFKSYK